MSAFTSRTNVFVAGEYVSINEGGKMHTYRVTWYRIFEG